MRLSRLPAILALAAVPFVAAAAASTPASTAEQEQAAERPAGSVAVGKALFRVYCTSCHGPEARGDGPLAEHMRVQPADLTRLAADNEGVFPRESVHRAIDGRDKVRGHGDSDMPVWGDVFLHDSSSDDEDEVARKIASLVAYLQTIQEAEPGRTEIATFSPGFVARGPSVR